MEGRALSRPTYLLNNCPLNLFGDHVVFRSGIP
jgi:hypothetical protein